MTNFWQCQGAAWNILLVSLFLLMPFTKAVSLLNQFLTSTIVHQRQKIVHLKLHKFRDEAVQTGLLNGQNISTGEEKK